MKAFGVPEILQDTVGHGSFKSLQNQFPHANPKVFEALPEKKLDLHVSNANRGLQPKCPTRGTNCLDGNTNLCFYDSLFSHGHVLIGSLKDSKGGYASKTGSIHHIALCKVFLALEGTFFKGEELGILSIE